MAFKVLGRVIRITPTLGLGGGCAHLLAPMQSRLQGLGFRVTLQLVTGFSFVCRVGRANHSSSNYPVNCGLQHQGSPSHAPQRYEEPPKEKGTLKFLVANFAF